MNNEFKKIAKQLGIAIPACLLSIGVANAETVKENEMSKSINAAVSEISKSSLVNNEVVKFLTTDYTNGMVKLAPDHTNYHSNAGGDHADQHSNSNHVNRHSNVDAKTTYTRMQNPDGTYSNVPSCTPHTNNHSNSGSNVNSHTNRGNKVHTNKHTNQDYKSDC